MLAETSTFTKVADYLGTGVLYKFALVYDGMIDIEKLLTLGFLTYQTFTLTFEPLYDRKFHFLREAYFKSPILMVIFDY